MLNLVNAPNIRFTTKCVLRNDEEMRRESNGEIFSSLQDAITGRIGDENRFILSKLYS